MRDKLMVVENEDFEKDYWELVKRIQPEEDIRPLNLAVEEAKYLDSVAHGIAPSPPMFRYRNADVCEYIRELNILERRIENLNPDLQNIYSSLTKSLNAWLSNFSRRGSEFGEWLYEIYGQPDSSVVNKAREIIHSLNDDVDKYGLSEYADPIEYFENVLKEYDFIGWNFIVSEMPASIRISATEKCIYIKEGEKFTLNDLDRLSKHEIGTHVLRHENGRRSNYIVLRYGMPGYLETEEGLAIYSEYLSGLLSSDDMKKYCLRVIASDLTKEHGFNVIFNELREYTTNEEAFSITARVKRGLTDTSQKWGYSKDQVYFSGFLKVRELSDNDLRSLYVGKIGIENIDWATDKVISDETIIPDWVLSRQMFWSSPTGRLL